MLCSGSILQTFLLMLGLSEQEVYLYNAIVQLAPVATMILLMESVTEAERSMSIPMKNF